MINFFALYSRNGTNNQPKITPLRAVAIKKKLNISRNKYEELIKMIGHGVLPSKNSVKKFEDTIKINLEPFLGGHKVNNLDQLILIVNTGCFIS